jgi:hypothetical protein
MQVRLALARACPEILATHDERVLFFIASFVGDGDAALFSE